MCFSIGLKSWIKKFNLWGLLNVEKWLIEGRFQAKGYEQKIVVSE